MSVVSKASVVAKSSVDPVWRNSAVGTCKLFNSITMSFNSSHLFTGNVHTNLVTFV